MSRINNRDMWVKHIENQKLSGISRKKWCENNNINFHSLAYWIGRLNKESHVNEPTTQWATVIPDKGPIDVKAKVLEVSIGKAVIEVSDDTCMTSFESVVEVLIKYA